ncbi:MULTISPECIES: recombinase family protein [Kitasatospora]|uniref:Putative recombinase n=1 Tax=Kitasatospora setae (strain ATCC 33774 / DSM 43861 / JCM 3304 / KCC A-0304 / NBRC 14216 / KM-6054) TaxID=452652 RepID=E4NHP7_KITSK|nr:MULTISPECIES: recombinase family protein [Kitasatospora]BAJ31027.1 putative recombinase [Kitasatospora setae KM-6054]
MSLLSVSSPTLVPHQRLCDTAIYARLSRDRQRLSENVNIQIAECQAFADEQGWPVVGVFPDDDVSASKFSKKPRDQYELMLAAVRRGEINIILITEMPRLYRRMEELLDVIRLAETTKLRLLITTDGISYDLSTAEGIHAAINAVNNAMLESARTSKRIKRKQAVRAKQGKVHGGGRPYGYEADGLTIRESEAEVIREAAERFIIGESCRDLVCDFNARGIRTATGKLWRIENLQRTLLKKRYIGVREYDGQEYPAEWPAILTREQWEQMEARRLSRSHGWPKGKTGTRKYLLSGGLIYCGRCGGEMVGNGRTAESGRSAVLRYRCRRTDNHGNTIGCGKTFRIAAPVELLVKEAVLTAFDDPKIAVLLAPKGDEDQIRELVKTYEARKAKVDQLVTDYATGVLTREQFILAKQVAEAAIQEIRELLAQAQQQTALAQVPANQSIREAWDTAGLAWRQKIVGLVVEKVVIVPGGRPGSKTWRGFRFDPEFVRIEWKA